MRVAVERLTKTYRDRRGAELTALEDVSLAAEPEEFLAILGPSGCGKSTLLNVIAGLLPATAGGVFFEGARRPGQPLTATVFQEFALFPWRTVQGNVELGLEELGLPAGERARRARRQIELAGLAGFEDRYPHQLSGGMRQRVGIARALAVDPAVLLMDEPFSALDAQTRTLMMEELLGIWERTRKTILYVTHNIQEAVFMADRVLVLSRRPGRVLASVPVPLARPRREAMAGERAFVETADRIWGLIRSQAAGRAGRGHAVSAGSAPPERIAVPHRAAFLTRREHRLVRAAALLGLVAAWEGVARMGWVPALFLPSPAGVLAEFADMLRSGEIAVHVGASLQRLALGFAVGAVAGVAVGVAVGFFSMAEAVGSPLIAATFPIPKIALLPLLILWLGIGEASKVAVIALGVFFPMAINTHAGVRQADPLLVRAAVSFGAGRWSVIRKVIVPSALPMVFAGLKLGAGTALLLLVAAEMVAVESGIGFLVVHAGNLMATTKLMVGIALLSLLGVLSHWLLATLERVVIPWRHT